MRVIAGKARRLLLKTIEGQDTRPTTDRVKETLFNILNPELAGCYFLDLFAGSGAIGIEALSRGARQAVFIEENPKAAACIRANLAATRLEEDAMVMNCDVFAGLERLAAKGILFDIVFFDPPYGKGLEYRVLQAFTRSCLIHKDTLLVAESSLDTDFGEVSRLGYAVEREKCYKTNKHVFVKRQEPFFAVDRQCEGRE